MQTREAPVQEAAPEQPETKHRNGTPWLIAAAVVLGLIAVGLVMWALDDDASDPQLTTVAELVDTMHEGLNEGDIDKATSVFTEDGVWVWEGNAGPAATSFARVPSDFTWERVSEVTELGEGHYIFVQQFGSDEITRAAVVIELDGDLMSQGEWVTEIYGAPAD